jgi:hypothetical protein
MQALIELAREKIARYQIAPNMVTRHLDVAMPRGRKSDPAGLPWANILAQLFPTIDPPSDRSPRPEPATSGFAELLLAESYRQVGAVGQQHWGLAQVAANAQLGMPVGAAFDHAFAGRLYLAQSFGRDTLICAAGEWQKAQRLSQLTSAAQRAFRDSLLAAVYTQAGEQYHADWAMHQEAMRLQIGPPLDRGQRLSVAGQEYVAGCYALDVLYSPVGQWQTVGRLSALPEGGVQGPLRAALYNRWCLRVGIPARLEWSLHQEALRTGLGAPLGPSFRVRYDGRDYVAEAFALDTLACEIGSWRSILRMSTLAADLQGDRVPVVTHA